MCRTVTVVVESSPLRIQLCLRCDNGSGSPPQLRPPVHAVRLALDNYGASLIFCSCDIKTTNFLIDEHFEVKLADFGESRPVVSIATETEASMSPAGTPLFMSPEMWEVAALVRVCCGDSGTQVILGRTDRYDEKVDIYSLTMCLWCILTRRDPREGFMGERAAKFRSPPPKLTQKLLMQLVLHR